MKFNVTQNGVSKSDGLEISLFTSARSLTRGYKSVNIRYSEKEGYGKLTHSHEGFYDKEDGRWILLCTGGLMKHLGKIPEVIYYRLNN